MEHAEARHRLRLALSYQENVQSLMIVCERALRENTIDQTRYDGIKGFYATHLQRAERSVKTLREAERRKLDSLEHELRDALNRQSQLTNKVARGLLSAVDANEENRRCAHDVATLKRGIAVAQGVVEARGSADLGGFVNLPLDNYSRDSQSQGPSRTPTRLHGVGRWIAVCVAIVVVAMGVTVFVLLPGASRVSVEGRVQDANGTRIDVTCRNPTSDTVVFHVPWAEGTPNDSEEGSGGDVGIQLYVLERDKNAMRLLPVSEGCWIFRGYPLLAKDAIEVLSGQSATVTLDTGKLKALGVDIAAIRLEFTRADGKVLGGVETNVH